MTKKKTADPNETEALIDDGKRIKWRVQNWNIKDLTPHPKNPRIISDDALSVLGDSFDEIGFAQPININTDGTILSGHARVMKLKKEGAKTVDCYVPDRKLTPKQEEAVLIRMNKNVAGKWDFDLLMAEFNTEDILEWGFQDWELPTLGADVEDFFIDKVPPHESEIPKTVIKIELVQEDYDKAMAYLKKNKISAEEVFMQRIEQ